MRICGAVSTASAALFRLQGFVESSRQFDAAMFDQCQRNTLLLSSEQHEGFVLPVAEVMACGCAVVGYSGF